MKDSKQMCVSDEGGREFDGAALGGARRVLNFAQLSIGGRPKRVEREFLFCLIKVNSNSIQVMEKEEKGEERLASATRPIQEWTGRLSVFRRHLYTAAAAGARPYYSPVSQPLQQQHTTTTTTTSSAAHHHHHRQQQQQQTWQL